MVRGPGGAGGRYRGKLAKGRRWSNNSAGGPIICWAAGRGAKGLKSLTFVGGVKETLGERGGSDGATKRRRVEAATKAPAAAGKLRHAATEGPPGGLGKPAGHARVESVAAAHGAVSLGGPAVILL